MNDYMYPCDHCSGFCEFTGLNSKDKRTKCKRFESYNVLTDTDIEILKSQIRILFTNLDADEVADVIYDILYTKISSGTADKVGRAVHKRLHTYERW